MQLSLLLFALGMKLRWSTRFDNVVRKRLLDEERVIVIRTADSRWARSFVFRRNRFSTHRGTHPDATCEFVWANVALAIVRDLDVLGFVMLNSPTVGEAAENAIRYFGLHQTSTELRCVPADGRWTVSYRPLGHPKSSLYQDGECTIGVLVAGLAALTGGRSRPLEAHFRRPEPAAAAEYRRLLPDILVRFAQPVTAVVYEAPVMEEPVVGADDHLLPIVSSHAEFLLSKVSSQDSLQRSLEDAVARSFSAGGLAIDEVARTLGMSRRTLQRRLNDRGTTFHGLADKVRERLALQHVRANSLTLTEIAFLLGYSESSAFGRAFRRWTGQSPREFRRNATA